MNIVQIIFGEGTLSKMFQKVIIKNLIGPTGIEKDSVAIKDDYLRPHRQLPVNHIKILLFLKRLSRKNNERDFCLRSGGMVPESGGPEQEPSFHALHGTSDRVQERSEEKSI
jgi:hypothetical protein